MKQSNRLEKMSTHLIAAQERKSTANGKRYTLYRLAKDTGIDYGHIHRVMHGKSVPSPEVINKICKSLECTPSERAEIIASIYIDEEEERAA